MRTDLASLRRLAGALAPLAFFALLAGLALAAACQDGGDTARDLAGPGDMTVIGCGQARGGYVPDACAPSGATAADGCRCIIGWHWDGAQCAGLGGCACTAFCDRVYPSEDACRAAYAGCLDAK